MAPSGTTRRDFMRATGLIGAVGLTGRLWTRADASATTDATVASSPYSMAMHLHGPFSEGIASMEAHLQQATATGVDVVWWTEHDHRMSAHRYRRAVHFDAMSEVEGDTTWTWRPANTGALATGASGGIVTSPVSPRDAHPPGALRLTAVSAGTAPATLGFAGKVSRDAIRTSLDGLTIEVDVRPDSVGAEAYLDLTVEGSYRPARNGQSAGRYELSYRVGGTGTPGSVTAGGRVGVVTLAAPGSTWTTLRLNPAADMTRAWPDVDGRDCGFYRLVLKAVSRGGAKAEGFFDNLAFHRSRSSGNLPLATQAELMDGYAAAFPAVRQHQALEMSLVKPHLGWYGGTLQLPDHGTAPSTPDTSAAAARAVVDAIHAAGGLASYNHPFEHGGPHSAEKQESLRRAKATQLIRNRALGADILEVGYRLRGGVTLERHLALWDGCSRNAVFLTGTGVSDDHEGNAWLNRKWNFLTWVWASSTALVDLVDALRRGRAYFGDPARFRGALDLMVDGAVPMGAVHVGAAAERVLEVVATDVPASGHVEVVRGAADLAGPTQPDPVTTTTVLPATAFATGSASVRLDATTPCFVRTMVRDPSGLVVAASNPVWLLQAVPPSGVPAARTV